MSTTTAARRAPRIPRWPLLLIALGAFVSIWGGWVGLGEMAGFGPIRLLPGIADSFVINSAITLPIGVEAYAAYALWAWLAPAEAGVSERARRFACWSSISALGIGVFGQATYHLLVATGAKAAPWQVVIFVSCLPVLVLGAGAALAHLVYSGGDAAADELPTDVVEDEELSSWDEQFDEHGLSRAWETAPAAELPVTEPIAPMTEKSPADLVAEGWGRVRLQKELGLEEYDARQLVEQNKHRRSNGHKAKAVQA